MLPSCFSKAWIWRCIEVKMCNLCLIFIFVMIMLVRVSSQARYKYAANVGINRMLVAGS